MRGTRAPGARPERASVRYRVGWRLRDGREPGICSLVIWLRNLVLAMAGLHRFPTAHLYIILLPRTSNEDRRQWRRSETVVPNVLSSRSKTASESSQYNPEYN